MYRCCPLEFMWFGHLHILCLFRKLNIVSQIVCLGLKIYSKLLTLWLKLYYRSCLTRQIFSVIYIFPLLTEVILTALHLSSWDCLFKSFFHILSHYSTRGTSYKHFPLLIFYLKKQLENPSRGRGVGRGEKEKRGKMKGEKGTEKDFSQTTEDSWPTSSLGPCLLSYTFENVSQMLCYPHLIMMCTIAGGRRSHSVSARGKNNATHCRGIPPVLTVSCSYMQM